MTPEQAALLGASWGTLSAAPRLIGHRENAVFEVQYTDGTHAALRLHRPGYQSTKAIEAELLWTERLAERGFPCPKPIRTLFQTLWAQSGDLTASLVSWIDAPCIGSNGQTFNGSLSAQCSLYRQLGQTLRALHDTTDALDLMPLDRPRWDVDGLTGDTPLWGRFWDNPTLSTPERETLLKVKALARNALLALPESTIGLIHADALQENVLARDGQMWLIDFDDSGYGFRGFDLAVALSQHVFAPERPALADALLEGYGDPSMAQTLSLFALLRACASCGWIVPRSNAGDSRQRLYAERALHLTHVWLDQSVSP